MEDDTKILKVEYLSNPLWDHIQVLNLRLFDQTIFYKSVNEEILQWKMSCNGRQPPNEDDFQLKMTSKR